MTSEAPRTDERVVGRAAPCVVWGTLALLAVILLAARPAATLLALPASIAVLVVRRLRGRTHAADAILPAVWMHIGHADAIARGHGPALWVSAALLTATYAWLVTLLRPATNDAPSNRVPTRWLVFGALLWLSAMRLPYMPNEPTFGASWRIAEAELYKRGAQWGIDAVFTYGPLGGFILPIYDREIVWRQFAWQGAIALVVTALLIAAVRRLDGRWRIAGAFCIALVFQDFNAVYFLGILGSAVTIVSRPSLTAEHLVAALAFPVVVACAKFTYFLLGAACILTVALAAWRLYSWRATVAVIALTLALFLAAWTGAGQSPANLGTWIVRSADLAMGYNAAMAQEGSLVALSLGVLVLASTVALAVGSATEPAHRWRRATIALLVIGVTLAGFKAGFVSLPREHVGSLFFVALAAPFFLATTLSTRRSKALFWGAVALAGLGAHAVSSQEARTPFDVIGVRVRRLGRNAAMLATLPWLHQRGERWRAKMRELYDLPRTRAAIGTESVDLFSQDLVAVFFNDLNWLGRPVCQSYSVHTPALAQLNRDHFRGTHAPKFVIVRLQPFGEHPNLLEDGPALDEVSARYEHLFSEGSYTLLRRRERPPSHATWTLAQERTVRFGDEIELPHDGRVRISIDVPDSFIGRMRSLLLRHAPVFLEVTGTDARAHRYRLVPALARDGFLVSPLLHGEEDARRWLAGGALPHASRVRVICEPGHESYFDESIRVRALTSRD